MSFGKMNAFIDITTAEPVKDIQGFVSTGDTVLASIRAYKEDRHGNEKWANRAAFSTATSLFRFRKVPKLVVATDMFIIYNNEKYNIVSVENVKGRGMYMEVMAVKIQASEG